MRQTFFQHYVLGGGWSMVLLVPASVVVLATIFRMVTRLWGSAPQHLAAEVRAVVLAQKQRVGSLGLADARTIAMDTATNVYMGLQPLTAIYAIAPLIGALGTAWTLGQVWRGPVSLREKNLQLALEQAFVPLGWGLLIGLAASTGYAILRARLVRLERNLLAPAAIAALYESGERTSGSKI